VQNKTPKELNLNNPGFQAGDYEKQKNKAHPQLLKKDEKLHEPQNKR
jgi:hypothetical protein